MRTVPKYLINTYENALDARRAGFLTVYGDPYDNVEYAECLLDLVEWLIDNSPEVAEMMYGEDEE